MVLFRSSFLAQRFWISSSFLRGALSCQEPAAAWQRIAEADVIHFHLLEQRPNRKGTGLKGTIFLVM